MQSNKVELEKREFVIMEPSIGGFQITCWQRRQEKYSIHAFSAVYESAEQLLANYADVRDYIAMYFQSEILELDIERWNMYEFIFMRDKLEEGQKQQVEQDKFSTRKLVFDDIREPINDAYIQATIIEELFVFEVQKRTLGIVNIDTHLRQGHLQVMTFMDTDRSDDNPTLTNALINLLGHGED